MLIGETTLEVVAVANSFNFTIITEVTICEQEFYNNHPANLNNFYSIRFILSQIYIFLIAKNRLRRWLVVN